MQFCIAAPEEVEQERIQMEQKKEEIREDRLTNAMRSELMNQHLRIGDMAEQSKPCEKAMQYGVQVLTDAELLAVILRSGNRDENAIVLSERILNLDPLHPGLHGLNSLSMEKLLSVSGIGKVKAVQLKAITELSRRMSKEEARGSLSLDHPETIARFFREDMRYLEKERVYAAFFNSAGGLIKEVLISEGTVDKSLLTPREVFVEACECRAVSIVILHNHPSGDVEPSRYDIYMTAHIYEIGEMMGIRLLDHLIIGGGTYFSFAERGLLHET